MSNPVEDMTTKRMLVMVELADRGTVTQAADAVGLTPAGTRLNLQAVRKIYDDPVLLGGDDERFKPTPLGERLLPSWRNTISDLRASGSLKDQTCKVAYLPQHQRLVTRARNKVRKQNSNVAVVLDNLGEEGRTIAGFEQKAVHELTRHVHDLAVGLRPQTVKDLHVEPLYWARLEAMIPRAGGLKSIEVAELVLRDLCVAEIETRSRKGLEDAILNNGIDDPRHDRRIILEATGTKGLLSHALENEDEDEPNPTVVVASDIAHIFKEGQLLGGPRAVEWDWVPVLVNGREIRHQIWVTSRRDPSLSTQRMIEAMHETVDDLGIDVGPEQSAGHDTADALAAE
jgi:hypothetical protein